MAMARMGTEIPCARVRESVSKPYAKPDPVDRGGCSYRVLAWGWGAAVASALHWSAQGHVELCQRAAMLGAMVLLSSVCARTAAAAAIQKSRIHEHVVRTILQ
eukprot:SAG31_NODE_1625_length_7716_cov_23.849941_3_plen_103_part_00